MFCSSLPLVVCRRTYYVFVYICLRKLMSNILLLIIVLVFCVVLCCALFVLVLCLVYQMLFLWIVHSVFSNVYCISCVCLRIRIPTFCCCSSFKFFVVFFFVLCLVYPMLPISLDCPFLIAPSVFSNVYLIIELYFFTRGRLNGVSIPDLISVVYSAH